MSKVYKDYLVVPNTPQEIPAEIAAQNKRARRDWSIKQQQDALQALATQLADIVKRDGGQIVVDGSGYGVEGHKDQYASFLLLKISEEAYKEIAKLSGVSINENILAHAACTCKKPHKPSVQ